MVLRKTFSANARRGLTLIEVLITLALIGAIGGFSLYVSVDDTRSYGFRDTRDHVVAALQRARAQAMHGVCRSDTCAGALPHGVHIEAETLTLFEGASYALRNSDFDETLPIHLGETTLEGFNEVVFAPISGRATVQPTGEWRLTFTHATGKESVIEINSEGRISWTN